MKVQSKILRSKDNFTECLQTISQIICNTPRASGTSKAHASGWARLMARHRWMPSNAVCERCRAAHEHKTPTCKAAAPSAYSSSGNLKHNGYGQHHPQQGTVSLCSLLGRKGLTCVAYSVTTSQKKDIQSLLGLFQASSPPSASGFL